MVVGIDEVGRGPLAGPVTVGAFIAPYSMRGKLIKLLGGKIKDSKKLTHEQRSSINRSICDLKQQGKVDFRITHISNSAIDKKGISKAITQAITLSLKKLHHKFSNTKGHPWLFLIEEEKFLFDYFLHFFPSESQIFVRSDFIHIF